MSAYRSKSRGTSAWVRLFPLAVISVVLSSPLSRAQTPSTGAVTGYVSDPSGAVLPGVTLKLKEKRRAEMQSAVSDVSGRFGFLLLAPGEYELHADKSGFRSLVSDVHVIVTETVSLHLHMQLTMRAEQVEVSSEAQLAQVNTQALGRAVTGTLTALPLVTRNFTQITTLSPGIASGANNAAELGNGATALSQIGKSTDGIFAQGARSYDNNWLLDGITVSDLIGTGPASSGVPLPNPDSLQEFKVQTGMYDAAYGGGVGANVSIITKTGSNEFHGTLFEFFRNSVLNANDYFLNAAGQARAALNQNQFGVSFGGPLKRDKLHFFTSYQGTRQKNGLATGQSRIACSATLNEPPLTNDRSPQALGRLFGGMQGQLGGVAILPDGSNINPAALALLNYKLPDGSFLVPTPQTIDASKPFESQGFSAFSDPCSFNEDQFLGNIDFVKSSRSQFVVRTFVSASNQNVTFVGNGLNPDGNTPGFRGPGNSQHVVVSIAHTFAFSSSLLNDFRFGFVQGSTTTEAKSAFKWSDVGVAEGEMNNNNELPSLAIAGSVSMASAFPRTYSQDSFRASDNLSWLRGAHMLKVGGSIARSYDDIHLNGAITSLRFLSWPDFLLGLDAQSNGTGTFSNVSSSGDFFGLLDRHLQAWYGSAFVQDDYRIRSSLTLNLGLRYERLGQFGDALGRNSTFDFSKADRDPSPTGSLDGYIVGSNFSGTLPPGVTRAANTFATYGDGQNSWAPRIGLAWQPLPHSSRMVLRTGYGMYYSRPPAQVAILTALAAPFALTRISTGASNAAASFQTPFAQPFPTPASFPLFVPYSPTTNLGINSLAPDFRPALVQQFGTNVQAEILRNWLFEVGYVGTRATHLQRFRSLNQALSASAAQPINGQTEDTVANIPLRVPIPGIRPDSLREMESEGASWYNALETSLSRRFSNGLQLLASYTFSKILDTDGSDINSVATGNALTLGDQNSPRQRWGRASFDRTHRFVLSGTWALPSPSTSLARSILGDWSLSGIALIQSGAALTIAATNSKNVYGISEDRAQLTGTCAKGQFVTAGPIGSKLNSYFNTSCFTTAPIIGADGIGTGFGNSATGLVDGPGQANLDVALAKLIRVHWPREDNALEFRAEFFNALNHPQFANPDTNFSSPTFGVISGTAVNPRVGQLAVKFMF